MSIAHTLAKSQFTDKNMKKLFTFIKTHTSFPVVSVLRLQGVISSSVGRGNISLETLRKKIDDAFKPDRLSEVLISVNSPGGSPVQSDLITSYIQMKAGNNLIYQAVLVLCDLFQSQVERGYRSPSLLKMLQQAVDIG